MVAKDIMEQTKATKSVTSKKLGGLRTMPFIITNEALEKVATYGLQANMILYLINEYHLEVATGASILFLWTSLSYLTPILGAFLSDSWLGRFCVITLGTIISLLGIVILWFTAIFPKARPVHCDLLSGEKCVSPKPAQLLLLLSSFVLMSIGSGGIKPCSMAFGADQMENPENPKNASIIQSFFNWYYASVGLSVMIAVTVMVYIQDSAGWVVGFGVGAGVMLLSTIFFLLVSSVYVKVPANKKLSAGFLHVIAAAWKNRRLDLPPENFDGWYSLKGSKLVTPTHKLRYLNKACMITSAEKDLSPDGLAIDPWSLCTVRQVEELKVLINVLPIWSTGIMIGVVMNQNSFPVVQASTMERHIFPHIKLPAASFSIFVILTLTIWVVVYDRLLVPLISKYTKRPRGLTRKQRIGAGLVLSCLATAVAAEVERHRRSTAIKEGFANNAQGVVTMSARWLVPQYCLSGLAEAFNAIGQIEFFYSQLPKSMASIAVSLFTLGFGIGSLLASLIVTVVNDVTKKWGVSWVSSNLNQGRYDYYYLVLTVMSVVNFLYYLLCSWAYGSCEDKTIWDEDNDDHDKKEEEMKSEEYVVVVTAA
ncbi:putative proton-dependent oligopeptide transporter family, major facilitator superfamily [Rosa chinensis]|uniref:Putative proton-dependent oligopeptide transporter family, major facilitator superfamily n=1 Tax=Rosa chinensis TaxID=74649 RepID=A0A2P6RSS2_ROSCH|nr:protein NRT1/ PTR FAMILY 1.1 [Rosa chinensis]PRQ49472.1 putative proton-dependent oligopeptide transporter family, major facilitator superfamily [Rosa chinensis]